MSKKALFSELIGESPAFKHVLQQAEKIARSHTRVLITGESGTGKERIAARLHAQSPRQEKPFVTLNCSALPPELLESEIFGHVKGAFTGAHKNHEGLATAAHGGTLFLDEIGDLAPGPQAKLLRFIETGEFRPVGSTETRRADARIISATHKDLQKLVHEGAFRHDLYFRLSVLTLHIPSLRERQEDIPLLARHLLEKISTAENRPPPDIAGDALDLLARQPWHGNIRELENVLSRALVLNESGTLTADMLLPCLSAAPEKKERDTRVKPLWETERDVIEQALRACNGNIPKAAALLQVNPSTLYRRKDLPQIIPGIGATH